MPYFVCVCVACMQSKARYRKKFNKPNGFFFCDLIEKFEHLANFLLPLKNIRKKFFCEIFNKLCRHLQLKCIQYRESIISIQSQSILPTEACTHSNDHFQFQLFRFHSFMVSHGKYISVHRFMLTRTFHLTFLDFHPIAHSQEM